jgi:hypothetical protein
MNVRNLFWRCICFRVMVFHQTMQITSLKEEEKVKKERYVIPCS